MNIESLTKDLSSTKLIKFLSDSFQTDILENLAKDCSFIERKSSRLSTTMFLELNLCNFGEKGTKSLTEQCRCKQSLDARYNTYAVKFVKACFETMFRIFLSDFKVRVYKVNFLRFLLSILQVFNYPLIFQVFI